MVCHNACSLSSKGPCLISGFFDCCREFAYGTSQPVASGKIEPAVESAPPRLPPLHELARMGPSSRDAVQKFMFFATGRSSRADDGEEGRGGECMLIHQCLSTEYCCYHCIKIAFDLFNVTSPQRNTTMAYTHVRTMPGVFTRFLYELLIKEPNCELGEIKRKVIARVVARKGNEQEPVRGGNLT